jgi:ATP-dependent helicase/nuclease subunit B
MAHGGWSATMMTRVFLGWDRPFLNRSAEWLLERRDELPRWLVIVPTSQSGRRLREAMAEKAGALLTPKFTTPGALLKTPSTDIAADWIERVAWLETLENTADWSTYQELFPHAPDVEAEWAGGLAMEMVALRHALQENGLSLSTAARLLASSVEAGRWEALGRLENRMEALLRSWGLKSRSRVLAEGVPIPADITGIVLAGITEMPPLVERALLAWDGPITALIGAPESEANEFSPTGKPLESWATRTMPWPAEPAGSVRLTADSRQQASEALQAVSEFQTPSHEVALGSADTEAGDELANVFTRAGWLAFHPAAKPVISGLARWCKAWSSWLGDPKLAVMMDLLALPETAALIGKNRAALAEKLSHLRNDWMIIRPEDLRHRIATAQFRSDNHRNDAQSVLKATETLEQWRAMFLRGEFTKPMERLLAVLQQPDPEPNTQATEISNWFTAAIPMIDRIQRSPAFWIDLMLTELPAPTPLPPEGRVIDVQGWLELFFEPGRHLVLCGMNEGKVPARNTGDPWLGEAAGKHLGLRVNSDRAARDAFLYQAMLEARRHDGRVDVICAKSGAGGESFLPSRLLLAATQDELPERVKFLFRGIEPPEAGLRWHADWKWQPPTAPTPTHLNTTSLADYLACPFRYYLKHNIRMRSPEPNRIEWSARDFGNVAHEILERWGRDLDARELDQAELLHAWFSSELDRVVAEWFGSRIPLAVRIQTEALRQRLLWLARVQAENRTQNWQVSEVELQFEIPTGNPTIPIIRGKIDRIDRHRDHGTLRVIDYKTGKVSGVDKSHRRKITSNTKLPAHLEHDGPAVYSGEDDDKPTDFRWTNLQLPLYALAILRRDGVMPVPCYFTLGATEADVALHEWQLFSNHDLDAANACAEWIAKQIAAEAFWPPAEKVDYDDFTTLTAGRNFEEMFFQTKASGHSAQSKDPFS